MRDSSDGVTVVMDALVAAEELEGGLAVEVPGAAALAGIAVHLREESCA